MPKLDYWHSSVENPLDFGATRNKVLNEVCQNLHVSLHECSAVAIGGVFIVKD
jgi:hypothetical protein